MQKTLLIFYARLGDVFQRRRLATLAEPYPEDCNFVVMIGTSVSQFLWTRQLPPASRSVPHKSSASARVCAVMRTRNQEAFLPTCERMTNGWRDPRTVGYLRWS